MLVFEPVWEFFDILISCSAIYLASMLIIIYGKNISQLRWNFAWEFHPNGEFPRVWSTWNIKVASFISIFRRQMMQKWQGRQQARIKSCLKWVQIVHSLSSLSTFHEEFSSSFKKILTQMEMSCCSVAIKLGVQPYIFAVHLKTFRVGVYRVLMFSLSVFFVTFLETYSCYIWKHTVLTWYRFNKVLFLCR